MPERSPTQNKTPVSQDFRIALWPLVSLNLLALMGLMVFCGLFVLFEGHPGISTLEWVIISYFSVIGLLITVASALLAWNSGPVVLVSETGLQIETAWLLDKTFESRRHFEASWEDIANVSPTRFLTMGYLRLRDTAGKPILYLPLFLSQRQQFFETVRVLAPVHHPLCQWINAQQKPTWSGFFGLQKGTQPS